MVFISSVLHPHTQHQSRLRLSSGPSRWFPAQPLPQALVPLQELAATALTCTSAPPVCAKLRSASHAPSPSGLCHSTRLLSSHRPERSPHRRGRSRRFCRPAPLAS